MDEAVEVDERLSVPVRSFGIAEAVEVEAQHGNAHVREPSREAHVRAPRTDAALLPWRKKHDADGGVHARVRQVKHAVKRLAVVIEERDGEFFRHVASPRKREVAAKTWSARLRKSFPSACSGCAS